VYWKIGNCVTEDRKMWNISACGNAINETCRIKWAFVKVPYMGLFCGIALSSG